MNPQGHTEQDVIADFLGAMKAAGIQLDTGSPKGPHPVADGKLHRANALGKKTKKNMHVWYTLHLDGVPAGAFGDLAAGIEDTWCAKKPSLMTDEERRALRDRMKRASQERAEQQAAMNKAAAEAAGLIMKATGKAPADHPYLAKKGLPVFPGLRVLKENVRYTIDPEEEPKTARAGNLVVPMFTPGGELIGAQIIQPDGTKRFLKGTAKEGNYHSIGKAPEEGGVILIGEGYATAARLHEATGFLCIAAFDAGNLMSVAKAIRNKYPKSRIIICADNDRFTKTGDVENPGLTKATEAAAAVKARVAVPHFDDGDLTRTDFDDLAQLCGIEAVRSAIDDILNPKPAEVVDLAAERARRAGDEAPPMDSYPDGPGEHDAPDYEEAPPRREETREDGTREHPLDGFGSPHFRCLGIDGTTCYFQPGNVAQVIDLAAKELGGKAMLRLAPLGWWELQFPGKSKEGGVNWHEAANACMQACLRRRKFVPHNLVRGRGAWFEGHTPIFHSGDSLIVDGAAVAIQDHKSKFVYDEGDFIQVAIGDAATTEESRAFLNLTKSLRWQSSMSGYLLAGFCVIAPVCGFLKWRPHIWINGPAGSGKSTVMDKIIKASLGSVSHSVVGNTTEAGIRGMLGMDAMPVIFDESEPKDMASQSRIRSILDLARVASSESDGLIVKGTSNQKTKGYRARSMFVFASINTQIEGYADESRFTQLTLAPPPIGAPEEEEKAKKHYEKLVSEIMGLMTPKFATRLLARTILNLSTLRDYVDVFTAAATMHLGAQRLGDQLGPMLAGAYLLNTTKPVTVEAALEWIRKNDWGDHTARDSAKDTERFLQHVLGFMVKHNTPEGGNWERPIGELLEIAAYEEDQITQETSHGFEYAANKRKISANIALNRLGIRVHGDIADMKCDITTSHENFRRILKGTEWAGTKWRKILETIPDAVAPKGNRYFASGVNTPYVQVPVESLRGYKVEEA
ncbi:toprim domain-containing protein [Rhizobium sp. 1AS11]|uniref:toprim domain-containing protein n=1 Tax=Rhizobium acaciae TaxID=2989736 RepID=UPI00222249FE|nr:toprim domain-containing protein [Rhizobium acaciae]MCW1412173.1 toprim domain-containing protein [Rhizobium acaciae]MCW1744188.1 toprim domain-containing protein [Rhizobium acaciae]